MGDKGFVQVFAGGSSGAFTMLIVQPLDVLKTRQQQLLQDTAKYRGTLSTMKTILKEEGLRGFWKGTVPGLYRVIPGAGLNFFFLHHFTSYLKNPNFPEKKLDPFQALLAGSTARSCATLIMMPFTVVKTRFEGYQTNKYKGTIHAVRTIWLQEGLKGLWSGSFASIVRDAPFSGIYFGCYTQSKKYLFKKDSQLPTPMINFLSGSVAAAIATIITHPADLVKTRLQIVPRNHNDGNSYSGMMDVVKKIYRYEGWRGFYKGILPRLIRRPIASAVTWSLYEELCFFFLKKRLF